MLLITIISAFPFNGRGGKTGAKAAVTTQAQVGSPGHIFRSYRIY